MRNRSFKTVKTLLIGLSIVTCAGSASAAEYILDINKTEVLNLPVAASAVIIGNPNIADVSVHSTNTLFLIGRAYGETNLIVLDAQGQTVLNADISVGHDVPKNGIQLTKIGEGRESYSCTPRCLPAPVAGDSATFRGTYGSTGGAITNGTVSSAPAGPTSAASSSGRSLSGPPVSPQPTGNLRGDF